MAKSRVVEVSFSPGMADSIFPLLEKMVFHSIINNQKADEWVTKDIAVRGACKSHSQTG